MGQRWRPQLSILRGNAWGPTSWIRFSGRIEPASVIQKSSPFLLPVSGKGKQGTKKVLGGAAFVRKKDSRLNCHKNEKECNQKQKTRNTGTRMGSPYSRCSPRAPLSRRRSTSGRQRSYMYTNKKGGRPLHAKIT